ncbi:MAG: peptide chain release factor N(5)-glutamine methyltransferase [Acidobacteria bacterium]|nr:peptide chain release factor N(5)-glutamine methyltransferase [Acidobacteriota bacterium]
MPKIAEMLREATAILDRAGVAEARREAGSLLAFALGKDRAFLIAHSDRELSETEAANYRSLLQRRAQREPFQYITGRQEFYGLDFAVAPGVLIPRPETEAIVENALEILETRENPRFCEIGVGSGCISVSMLVNLAKAAAVGLDISPEAIAIARRNAETHRVAERFELRRSDVYEALAGERFDLIVSNPPYIPRSEIDDLQAEVRDFEPLNALTDGGDGLSIIEKIVAGAPRFLEPGGWLLMEIGFGQAAAVGALFDRRFWRSAEILADLQGIPRTVRAQTVF